MLEISFFSICVPKTAIRYSSWDTEWHKFFCHLGPFFEDVIILNLCNKNTIKWCMLTKIWSVTDIIICHFRSVFALLSHYWPGKLKFGKMLKASADIILLHMCTINQGHMMYGSWDIKCKGQSLFCHFRPFILRSDPLSNRKSKFWKN